VIHRAKLGRNGGVVLICGDGGGDAVDGDPNGERFAAVVGVVAA